MESILTSIKKLFGILPEYTQFDDDLIIHINSALSVLTQLGVGPSTGFSIHDNTAKWSDFVGDDIRRIEMLKTYVYLKTRLIFDPPMNSSVTESIKSMISEFEWRLNVAADTASG